jgi:hypothetical protein
VSVKNFEEEKIGEDEREESGTREERGQLEWVERWSAKRGGGE